MSDHVQKKLFWAGICSSFHDNGYKIRVILQRWFSFVLSWLNYITRGSAVVFIWHTVKQTSQRRWSSSDSEEIFIFVSNYALKFRIFYAKACAKLLQIKHTSPVSPACHSQRWNFEVSSFSISKKKLQLIPLILNICGEKDIMTTG